MIPGHFVLTEPIPEGKKVKGEIVRILRPQQIKHFRDNGVWPELFSDTIYLNNTYDYDLEREKNSDHIQNNISDRKSLCSASKSLIKKNRRNYTNPDNKNNYCPSGSNFQDGKREAAGTSHSNSSRDSFSPYGSISQVGSPPLCEPSDLYGSSSQSGSSLQVGSGSQAGSSPQYGSCSQAATSSQHGFHHNEKSQYGYYSEDDMPELPPNPNYKAVSHIIDMDESDSEDEELIICRCKGRCYC